MYYTYYCINNLIFVEGIFWYLISYCGQRVYHLLEYEIITKAWCVCENCCGSKKISYSSWYSWHPILFEALAFINNLIWYAMFTEIIFTTLITLKLLSNLCIMMDANAFLDHFHNNLMKLCLKLDVFFFCKFEFDVMKQYLFICPLIFWNFFY